MSLNRLQPAQRVIGTPWGDVLGTSYRWPSGQYCALHTDRGLVGCGLYDCSVASRFGMVLAIARGTPEKPLFEPEDLLAARIVEMSTAARECGIETGMTGLEALQRLLTASRESKPTSSESAGLG
jgi:uncharacterized protein YunC (DUF1805 family)